MSTTVDPEAVTKLGLAGLELSNLPHLEVVVRNAKHDIVANVGAQIVTLIVFAAESDALFGSDFDERRRGARLDGQRQRSAWRGRISVLARGGR